MTVCKASFAAPLLLALLPALALLTAFAVPQPFAVTSFPPEIAKGPARLAAATLFLQVAKCLVRQPLLLAQGLGQTFHCLLSGRRLATRGEAVLHHPAQLLQKLRCLGHAPLFHQFLQPVQESVQFLGANFHGLALGELLVLPFSLLLGELTQVVPHRFSKFPHQVRDLFVARAVLDRLGKSFLCPPQSCKSV